MNGATVRGASIEMGERKGMVRSVIQSPALSAVRPLDPRPALVLFDLDDTLCDYAGARAARLRTAFGTALAHLPDAAAIDLDQVIAESLAIHAHGSEHFPELLARYGVADPTVAQTARSWYHTNRFLGLTLFADAVEMLGAIRLALPGRRIGLITNGPAEV
jgi:putative hydrolase of the HAD superfamily